MSEVTRRPKRFYKIALVIAIILCAVAGLALLGYSSWQLQLRHQATHNPTPTISTQTVTYSTDKPDETKPTEACVKYSVLGEQPKRIDLPTINEGGCLERVGVDQNGAIAVPTNIHVAGWYVDSALPGQKGLSIIDGHINGNYTSDGIFQHLDTLKAGDEFSVTRGDDKVLKYQTVSVKTVPLDDVSAILFNQDDSIESQLNLVTCGGKYDPKIKQFDHRVVVIARLI